MTHRERMLRALRGEPTDRIPYIPRLDLWYNANHRLGTLPAPYRKASLMEIVKAEDFGYHGIVPDFKDVRGPDDEIHRGIGVYNIWTMPVRTIFHNVKIRVTRDGDRTAVEYATPRGVIRTTTVYDDGMRDAGITISHISEHAVKSHADYPALAHIFENAEVVPNPEGYGEFYGRVGGQGLAAGFLSLSGSAMHMLLRDLMPFDLFSYEMFDHPEELAACAKSIGGYFDRMADAAMACGAEIIFCGANYDASLTHPPFFRDHILPWLKKLAEKTHREGKMLLTHTDGENTGLLDYYVEAGFDIADSICPRPMTKLTFREVRDVFKGRISIMGGIPSVCFLKSSMPDRDFEAYLEEFFAAIGKGDRLLLGISDTTPPGADFDRIRKVAETITRFGPVRP